MVRMPVLDVRLEDALGAGTVLAKFAGKVPLLGVYRPDVCLKISLLYRDELAEAATEHLHIVVDRIDVDLGVSQRKQETMKTMNTSLNWKMRLTQLGSLVSPSVVPSAWWRNRTGYTRRAFALFHSNGTLSR